MDKSSLLSEMLGYVKRGFAGVGRRTNVGIPGFVSAVLLSREVGLNVANLNMGVTP